VSKLRGSPAVGGVEVRLFDVLDGPSVITRGLSPSDQAPKEARPPGTAA
jgi:hypothetical protein